MNPLSLRRSKQRFLERCIKTLLFFSAIVSVFVTAGIIGVLFFETFEFFKEVSPIEFLTDTQWTPLFSEKHFGIMPLITGTVLVSFIAMIVSVPLGMLSAIYLSEYAGKRFQTAVKPALEILAGVPTVVYGYFALVFITPLLQKILPELSGFNAISSGMVMGIMILPMMSSLSEDAMRAVPSALKEGAYAIGATRLQVATTVIVPAALSGIMSAFILSMSRAIGETMIVAIAAGQQPSLTLSPFVPIETITAYIVQVSLGDVPSGTIEYRTIFAAGSTLFAFTLVLNIFSYWLKERFREEYK